MRIILTAIICCMGTFGATAQSKKEANQSFARVENEAYTDPVAWQRYLGKNLKIDSTNKDVPPGCYTVIVSFVVDIYGAITDVKVVSDPGHGLGEMAARTIRNYKGKWTPATQCGNRVKSFKKIPLSIMVDSEE